MFTDAERAVLELTEQGTRIADGAGGVTDEAWANAAKHYDDDQLATLMLVIALINATNRFAVVNRQRGGDYQPAQSAQLRTTPEPGKLLHLAFPDAGALAGQNPGGEPGHGQTRDPSARGEKRRPGLRLRSPRPEPGRLPGPTVPVWESPGTPPDRTDAQVRALRLDPLLGLVLSSTLARRGPGTGPGPRGRRTEARNR
ncbi:hypothetical protein [Nonomuraea dietziae]|uniref:carboxymuconolactone decarboxylase family protein n=1 Tax=Nonomuraea dietziae TaxID=65515 RepID=UPI0031E0DF6D